MKTQFKAAVVGLGYWGPNLCRNLAASQDFELVAICDRDSSRLNKTGKHYPGAQKYEDFASLLSKSGADLVCISTPVASHFALAKMALEAGSHVLLEKPLTATVAEAEELLALAKKNNRQLFVDHTFLFTGAVQEIRKQVISDSLGKLLYVDSVRINLGLFQPDIDVLWDLAPHDLSILQHVIGRAPKSVAAVGSSHNPREFVDVAYLHLDYGDALTAHLHLSWLSPVKVRRMIFAGTKQSLIYDDLDQETKVKLYDQGVAFDTSNLDARREVLVSYRRGDMRAPALTVAEALLVEFTEIGKALRGEPATVARGEDGVLVTRILEAATRS